MIAPISIILMDFYRQRNSMLVVYRIWRYAFSFLSF